MDVAGFWEWIAWIKSDRSTKYYSDFAKSHFTVSRDNVSSMLSLQVIGLTTEDTALYDCVKSPVRASEAETWQKPFFASGCSARKLRCKLPLAELLEAYEANSTVMPGGC